MVEVSSDDDADKTVTNVTVVDVSSDVSFSPSANKPANKLDKDIADGSKKRAEQTLSNLFEEFGA